MRLLSVVAIAGLLVACGRPIEVRGLYVNDDGAGALVPCDQPKTLFTVTDSGLATRYRRGARNAHVTALGYRASALGIFPRAMGGGQPCLAGRGGPAGGPRVG